MNYQLERHKKTGKVAVLVRLTAGERGELSAKCKKADITVAAAMREIVKKIVQGEAQLGTFGPKAEVAAVTARIAAEAGALR